MNANVTTKYLIQIVPALPPSINGLGDYALYLARQLRNNHGIETIFLVGDPRWQGSDLEGFQIKILKDRSSQSVRAALISAVPEDQYLSPSVLLHFVGYGYAKRGCPFWLLDGLRDWKKITIGRLVTFFHEIYAFGPPWSSSFWLSPFQKQIATLICALSDAVVTNREGYKDILNHLAPSASAKITVLPVFSTVGEPNAILPLTSRKPHMVIFGNRRVKNKAYQEYRFQVISACCALGIREILDIGVPTDQISEQIGNIPIRRLGILETDAIRQVLIEAKAGFLGGPPPAYIGKSSIFAAYCAYGLLPVVPISNQLATDGLTSGQHYWVPVEGLTIVAPQN